jgi:poly-gamma-glutamate synthesis protein (capsule biosynthesis protein)
MDSEGQNCVDYKLNVIPYSQTSTRPGNDFCPAPYEWGTDEYYQVLSKLGWSGEDE